MIDDFPPRPEEMTPAERRLFELNERVLLVGSVISIAWLFAVGVLG